MEIFAELPGSEQVITVTECNGELIVITLLGNAYLISSEGEVKLIEPYIPPKLRLIKGGLNKNE
jgi:hypothetical protein